MDKIVGLKEFRENVSTYAERVRAGDSLIVVRRSHPLFKLTPLDSHERRWEEVIDFTKLRRGGVRIRELLSRLSGARTARS